jgi:hypothetical protein
MVVLLSTSDYLSLCFKNQAAKKYLPYAILVSGWLISKNLLL